MSPAAPPPPSSADALSLFQQALAADAALLSLGALAEPALFSSALVCWLSIWQSLQGQASLQQAELELLSGGADPLTPAGQTPLSQRTTSAATGGYCRARQRLSPDIADQVADQLYRFLRARTAPAPPLYLLDGTTLSLPATADLVAAYPPARSQRGTSHWPLLRVVVAHELGSGLACRPVWGARSDSEQRLSRDLLARLPEPGTVITDPNFGVFSVVWDIVQAGHVPLSRLQRQRAQRILGSTVDLDQDGDYAVEWRPSVTDRRTNPHLPEEAVVRGRVVVQWSEREGQRQGLMLFTTKREGSPEQVAAQYGQRWCVETDLRHLKQTLQLDRLQACSVQGVHKELVLAVAAYNLIQALMRIGGEASGRTARQMSFGRVKSVIAAFGPRLAIADAGQRAALTERLRQIVAQCKLPQRRQRPGRPRVAWSRPRPFPSPTTYAKGHKQRTGKGM